MLDLSMRESGSIEHGWGAGTRGEVGSGVGSLEKSKSPLDFVTAFLRSISVFPFALSPLVLSALHHS